MTRKHDRRTRTGRTARAAFALEDVDDVEGYVARVVDRRFSQATAEDREDMIGEGTALMLELRGKWRSEDCPSFADFCSTYLPLRLIDWWRKEMRQRNVCRRNSGEGGRYEYTGVTSLDALLPGDEPASYDALEAA